jgi:hypothetical protein
MNETIGYIGWHSDGAQSDPGLMLRERRVQMPNTAMRISLVLTMALSTALADGQPPYGKAELSYLVVPDKFR